MTINSMISISAPWMLFLLAALFNCMIFFINDYIKKWKHLMTVMFLTCQKQWWIFYDAIKT